MHTHAHKRTGRIDVCVVHHRSFVYTYAVCVCVCVCVYEKYASMRTMRVENVPLAAEQKDRLLALIRNAHPVHLCACVAVCVCVCVCVCARARVFVCAWALKSRMHSPSRGQARAYARASVCVCT